ncbi:MAG: endonuclease III, partial [Coriobacteriaceae bacterium]|nr:endonuclease III [Coriobacteriaceae bacterium]
MPSRPAKPSAALKARADEIVDRLERLYPHARIALEFDTPFHLLCAVIMSAQTTDVTVNRVT